MKSQVTILCILAQAIEDMLAYELGLGMTGVSEPAEAEALYMDALAYVLQFERLRSRYRASDRAAKAAWLNDIQEVLANVNDQEGRQRFYSLRGQQQKPDSPDRVC